MQKYNSTKSEWFQELIGTTRKESIYHYTSIEGLQSILQNKTLRLGDISFMNDESEMKYTFDLISEYLDSVKKYNGEFKDFIIKAFNSIQKFDNDDNIFKYKYYVASFSINSDSLPIWVYYTKNSKSAGYNIEFDKNGITEIIKSFSVYGSLSGLVLYNKTKQRKIIKQILNKYFKIYSESPNEEAWNSSKKSSIVYAFSDLQLLSLFFKSSYFKNEEEYRIVIPALQFKDKHLIDINFRLSDGMFIPFVEVSFENKQEVVKGITISPTLKSILVEKGLREFTTFQKYKNLNIVKSKIPLRY